GGLRQQAVWTLQRIGVPTPEAISGLVELLHEPDVRLRRSIVAALRDLLLRQAGAVRPAGTPEAQRTLAPEGEAALHALIEGLTDPDANVRKDLASALEALARGIPSVFSVVQEALTHREPLVRQGVLTALSKFRDRGAMLLPGFLAALRDGDETIRQL